MSTSAACRFTVNHYREILEAGVEKGYRFLKFEDIKPGGEYKKVCVIRHDIDYTPARSLHFAEIENKLGITAAYFFQICAKPYNLREAENYKTVQELAKMGHTVGLHFDFTWKEDLRWKEMVPLCQSEKKVFRAITGVEPCEIISFHNPHRFAERILNQKIAGMRHSYEPDYFSSMKYISDSQGWYEGCMCNLFKTEKYSAYQFLTHPYIWPDESAGDFISDMAAMIHNRSDDLLDYMIEFHPVCRKYQDRLRQEVARRSVLHES